MKDSRVWTKSKVFPGVRWREHPTRKHGVTADRYFAIRYRLAGRDRQESLGWASHGWSEKKANARLAELLECQRTGQGEPTLAARRAKAEAERKARQEAEALEAREGITLAAVWAQYEAVARANKAARTMRNEAACFRMWVAPSIGNKPLKDIAPIHLERIKKGMADAGRAAQSIRHVLALVRQLINFAKTHGLFLGDNVVSKVKMPSADARRMRFLTPSEAADLLAALAARSPDLHDLALLSLNAGLRAGEAFALTWPDVDFGNGVLTLRDTKSGKTRQVPMTTEVRGMLKDRKVQDSGRPLVFPSTTGGRMAAISATFNKAVKSLGLDDGITDPRQKVCFHSLRHSFASWLVQNGVPLITVGRLLGHATTAMTERYSHLAPDHFRQAVDTLESVQVKKPGKVVVLGK